MLLICQLKAHEGIRLVADHTAHAAHDGVSERRVAPVAAVGIGVLAVRWLGMPPARVPSASSADFLARGTFDCVKHAALARGDE